MLNSTSRGLTGFILLIVVQSACAVFFIGDVLHDFVDGGDGPPFGIHLIVETIASLCLMVAIAVEILFAARLFRRQRHLEENTKVAAGAFYDVLESYFDTWRLTPSERDVALLTVKGLSIAEIAEMRGSKQGTVKAQLNAIYRKAEIDGRAQLIALLIEDIVAVPLSGREAPPTQP